MQSTNSLIKDLSNEFTLARNTAESAINQVPDSELIWKMDEKSNSIAILIKHIGGHLLSRFTDFLTTDGQKSFRNRALEFQNHPTNRNTLIQSWNKGWNALESTIESLIIADLHRIVTIRNQPYSVIQALLRALCHTHYHVGQIVELSRMKSVNWSPITKEYRLENLDKSRQ